MAENFDFDRIREALRFFMKRAGAKPTPLSLKVSSSKTLVKEILEKGSDIKLGTLHRLADALDVTLEDFIIFPRLREMPSDLAPEWEQLSEEDKDRVTRFVRVLAVEPAENRRESNEASDNGTSRSRVASTG